MKLIMENWNKFLNEQRVVSFDFDVTLHINGEPNQEMIDIMFKHSDKGDTIIIMTARGEKEMQAVHDFVKKYRLPVAQAYHTNGGLKGEYLKKLGCSLHYDDNNYQRDDVLAHGIKTRNTI